MDQRVHIVIRGAVQGVGFRPFVYRLARGLRLKGWVKNSPQGVFIQAEGAYDTLQRFLVRLDKEHPPRSYIQSMEYSFLDPAGFRSFEIRESDTGGDSSAIVLSDIAPCPDCLAEMTDPSNPRYGYPFTNCTNCGPRFTIIEALPYDRGNTTMKRFTMCPRCQAEYDDPADRRFHAQPNACPSCGPHLTLWDSAGTPVALRGDALALAAAAVREGKILALKGVGGFHLIVDARNQDAVLRLRERKHRAEKPLALMAPGPGAVKALCDVSHLEERLLCSPEAPILLLRRRRESPRPGARHPKLSVAEAVAPANPCLGLMLPPSPLHHMLMRELGFPVVATSGNATDEPICIEEAEALKRLCGIADLFLVHDRPIARPVDDSVVRIVMGRILVLRRARGFAPLPVHIDKQCPDLLAVGAHLKSAVAVARHDNVFVSQHLGDLETQQSFEAFRAAARDLQGLYHLAPAHIVCDLHPDYLSTQFARNSGLPVIAVQHHYAHVASCMADNQLSGAVLGVSWDGTGLGTDGTIWGGEFLVTTPDGFSRTATFRTFRLPGGQAAIKEPRRTAIGVLYELWGETLFERSDLLPLKTYPPPKLALLHQVLSRGVNSPETSSAGRLFDAVASIVGLRQTVSFEGQAAMELEYAIGKAKTAAEYGYGILDAGARPSGTENSPRLFVNWAPMVEAIVRDVKRQVPVAQIAAKFHNTLAAIIVDVARRIALPRVVLTGGCFQNRYLAEAAIGRLEQAGFHPYWHQRVPPNDGGIAVGQIYAAVRGPQNSEV